ncbi:MAG: transposase [Eubacterium sp.]|nr:transposase [Eubacterium sp.]
MGQKDLSEKILEDYNDVFADIANTLLYGGNTVVRPEDLTETNGKSQYKAGLIYHEQSRDVEKYWNRCGIRIAHCGIENQTNDDQDMPLRVISYDGGAYRAQLLQDSLEQNSHRKKSPEEDQAKEYSKDCSNKRFASHKKKYARYPVFTIVLYFGYRHRWNAPTRLVDCFHVPEELKPFVNDYPIHVFEIAFLDRETIDRFKSDFWIVADYFWQKGHNKNYIAPTKKIQHVTAVLQTLQAFTGDTRFVDGLNNHKIPEEGISMCEFLDQVEARGISIGEANGAAKKETAIRNLIIKMRDAGTDPNEILDAVMADVQKS